MNSTYPLYKGKCKYKNAIGSAKWCPLLKRFFYETMPVIPFVLMSSVCYRKVSAIKHVRYREVPHNVEKMPQYVCSDG